MKKIIIFLLSILFACFISFFSIISSLYFDKLLSVDDYGFGNVEVKENEATFEIYIYPETKQYYSKYKVEFIDETMIIKIYGSYINKTDYKKDETGNIYLSVPIDHEITEIKYVTNDKTKTLWKKEEEQSEN